MSALEGLGNARYFFVFLMGWSLVSNNVFNLYSVGLSAQLFGDWAIKVPRIIWTLCASILITILAVVGRDSFKDVLLNLLALIGYWSMIYFAIFTIEFVLIRRTFGLDLTAWNDQTKLPPGYAAGVAFCFGIMGSVLGMNQTWYQGYRSHFYSVNIKANEYIGRFRSSLVKQEEISALSLALALRPLSIQFFVILSSRNLIVKRIW